MVALEPNGMPALVGSRAPETFGDSAISTGISNHLRGNKFPAFVNEPRQMAFEGNRAAITDPRRTQPDDGAAEDSSSNARAIGSALDFEFDVRAWQQPVVGLDERSARRHVDQTRAVSRTYARGYDAVFLERVQTPGPASIW